VPLSSASPRDANETDIISGDNNKARKDLHAFAAANDPRLYKLLKACIDVQTDLKTLIKSKVSHYHMKSEAR
jgi:sister-chromatid-cohesion protein PDS5